jgi:hypothetical protein
MKNVKIAITAVAVLTLVTLTGATAQAATVYPTGDPAVDLPNVQAAVAAGGRVLLKATSESGYPTAFNFGYDFSVMPTNMVVITNDVQICGERDEDGLPMTTILGGFWTFYAPLTPAAFSGAPGPQITIKNIRFDGAQWAPIQISYTSGVKIKNNRITNSLPVGPFEIFGRPDSYWQGGVQITSLFDYPDAVVPYAITGRIVAKNNEVDLEVYPPYSAWWPRDPTATLGTGVFVVWSWGADVRIKGNTLHNITRNSIEVLNNYRDDFGNGSVRIKENTIVTAEDGIPVPSYSYPNGIVVGSFEGAGPSPEESPEFSICGNYVEGRGETSIGISVLEAAAAVKENEIVVKDGFLVDSSASGILIWGENSVVRENEITINPSTGIPGFAGSGILILSDYVTVKKNEITFDDPSAATGILQVASEGVIRSNEIEGEGLAGVLLQPFPPDWLTVENNMIRANDFEDFNPAMADVVLGSDPFGLGLTANYNTLVGDEDTTVIDEGIGNVILLDEDDEDDDD